MKRFSLFLIVIILISVSSSFQQVTAQEKTKEEQEKEQKIQQEKEQKIQLEIDQQKKTMADQKKAQEEANQVLKEQQSELDKTRKDVRVEAENAGKTTGEAPRIYSPRGNRSFVFNDPFDFAAPGIESFYGHGMSGDSERTTWDFSKSVKENTFTRDYTFDVEKSVKTVVMSIMGDCKAGEIRIKIIMPDGKNYSDIVIDEFGNLNWRKSFTISETENQNKAGEWKFQIASTKATGFFKISLQTF